MTYDVPHYINYESNNECDEKEYDCDDKISEESKIKKHSLLKKCDEINKQDNISFISDIQFGLNDKIKYDENIFIEKQFKPTMKVVFRHNNPINESELLFDVNMVKSEPRKILKDINSLKTVNKLFKLDDLNDICIKHFTKREYNLKYIGKCKSNNDTFFETGQMSLDFDHVGCDYSNYYTEIINIIYSYLKHYFMNLCDTLPSYERTKNTKVVGLLYSGGKDSTCRLLELLEKGEHVVPIVNTLNSHYSTELLLRDITTIYNLSKIYETKNFKGTLYKPKFLTYLSWCFDFDHIGLCQQPYNMMSLTALGKEFLNNCKRIECCLINGDMGVSYISEMTKLYKTAMKFNYSVVNGDVKSIPPLSFPYTKILKDDIINKLEIQLDNILDDDRLFYTIIPTCQEITVRSIKIAFNQNKYWLYVSLENCGKCTYCKTHTSSYYYTLCIPLSEIKPINKNGIVLSTDQICSLNAMFSNIFRAY